MILIPDILSPVNVLLSLDAASLSDVITRLAEKIKRHPAITDWDAFVAGLERNREICHTSLGNGLCIPHARGPFATSMVMAAARLASPVEARSGSGPVQQVFLLCVPQAMSADHLRLVGALARIFNDEETVSDLLIAQDPDEYLERLRKEEIKLR